MEEDGIFKICCEDVKERGR